VNWGGVAVDPETQQLFVNTTDIPLRVRLIPRAEYEVMSEQGFDTDASPQTGTPFGVARDVLLSSWGAPCSPPPWGRLTAVDLAAGEILWEKPFGTLRDVTPLPLKVDIGMPSLGGPLVTGGGLIFIGAAPGHWLRAFDTGSGEELWRGALPAGANATPMTYRVDDLEGGPTQFVVVAAGGHWAFHSIGGDVLGDSLVAFSLPAPR
jgi:quinoprotein glucose dehydrogenase